MITDYLSEFMCVQRFKEHSFIFGIKFQIIMQFDNSNKVIVNVNTFKKKFLLLKINAEKITEKKLIWICLCFCKVLDSNFKTLNNFCLKKLKYELKKCIKKIFF